MKQIKNWIIFRRFSIFCRTIIINIFHSQFGKVFSWFFNVINSDKSIINIWLTFLLSKMLFIQLFNVICAVNRIAAIIISNDKQTRERSRRRKKQSLRHLISFRGHYFLFLLLLLVYILLHCYLLTGLLIYPRMDSYLL